MIWEMEQRRALSVCLSVCLFSFLFNFLNGVMFSEACRNSTYLSASCLNYYKITSCCFCLSWLTDCSYYDWIWFGPAFAACLLLLLLPFVYGWLHSQIGFFSFILWLLAACLRQFFDLKLNHWSYYLLRILQLHIILKVEVDKKK